MKAIYELRKLKIIEVFTLVCKSTIGLIQESYSLSFYTLITIIIFFNSCKKIVDVKAPVTSTNADIVYGADPTAIAAINNIYTQMSKDGLVSGVTSMSLFPGLSSDELKVLTGTTDKTLLGYYTNALTTTNIAGSEDFWINIYSKYIFSVNSAIEGLTKSASLTPSIKQELLGETKFIRAFCYFYLVNLYGDVPLVLTTDYKQNSNIGRSAKSDVYIQIVTDLKDAQNLLSADYLDGTLLNSSTERITPNKFAATALLARVYLYLNNEVDAEIQSTSIIENKSLYDTVPLSQVFLSNSKEAIWQLQSVNSAVTNTSDARFFILPIQGPDVTSYNIFLSKTLINSFESSDQRKKTWVDSVVANGNTYYYPFKYKINTLFVPETERTVILRIAEQYLIRAEARLGLGKIAEALSDINVIRIRAGLPALSLTSKDEILNAIVHERQVELFTEWGHRWLDLKRLGLANQILTGLKGSNWQSTDQLYPIANTEILQNPKLKGEQNPGY
jgi:hypothetical protein